MQPLNFQTQDEFINAFLELVELNKDVYTPEEILAGMRDRGVFIGGKDIKKYNMSPENDVKIQSIIDGTYSEEGEDELVPGEYGYEEREQKKEEAAPKTEDNANNYQRLNDYVKRYNNLVKDKEEILSKYNGGEGYTPGSKIYNEYKSEIDRINNELKSMEKSDELTSLLKSIKDNGLGAKWYESESYARNGLADIINGVGSSFDLKDANFIGQAPVNSNFKSMDKLIDTYLGSSKGNNKSDNQNKETIKTDNKKGGQSSIAEDTFTDTMKFGEDVKSGDYVDKRNITLAQHLKARGLSTPEEIDAYLSKYPSWQNAKQERKDNTIKNLTDKIGPIKNEEKKEEVKQETKKEVPASSKKEDVKLWKPGSNWLPDDYSSINGVEEENSDTLIYDKNGNPVGSKVKETKKQDTKKQETNNSTNKGKKLNIVKGSETIKNLLKRSKK